MNKKQRNREKKREESKVRKHQTENRQDLIVPKPVKPDGSHEFVKTAKMKSGSPARPHTLMVILSIIGILLAGIALFWNIAQPDIRYIPTLGPETLAVLENKVDGSGNFVYSVRLRPKFTNFSFKPGFIDKVEFVPQSIATLPDIRITSIEKTLIYWHEEKRVEITFLMSIPIDAANDLNTTRELAVDQVLAAFDNTGKKVDHLPNGVFGRIRFTFKDIIKIQLNGMVVK
jgi:hypothetical protein